MTLHEDMQVETLVWDRTKHDFVPLGARPARQLADQFLRGPIPWPWLAKAASLPGRSLPVALCLWRLVGVMKKDRVRLASKETGALGIDRFAKARALRALETAGLITVERKAGRFPIVTIVRAANTPAGA